MRNDRVSVTLLVFFVILFLGSFYLMGKRDHCEFNNGVWENLQCKPNGVKK